MRRAGDWSIAPAREKFTPRRRLSVADWRFGSASSLPFAVGQLRVVVLARRSRAVRALARQAGQRGGSSNRTCRACGRNRAICGCCWVLGTLLLVLGLADDRRGARLAAAAGGATAGGDCGRVRARLEVVARAALAVGRGAVEPAVDRRAGELVQHARQHGRPVGRRRRDCGGDAGRRDAVGPRSADAAAASVRGRVSAGARRFARWVSCGTIARRRESSWATRGAISSASRWRRSPR